MSYYFLDSSALLKRYYTEQGTIWVTALTAPNTANTITIAQITPVEIISGIERRYRAGQVPLRRARAIKLLLNRHVIREYRVVVLTDAIVSHAQTLVSAHLLRAYDAVQLASALESNTRLLAAGSPPLTFVSADVRLLAAAAAEGLATADPNAYI